MPGNWCLKMAVPGAVIVSQFVSDNEGFIFQGFAKIGIYIFRRWI